jgi:hypothetical protein
LLIDWWLFGSSGQFGTIKDLLQIDPWVLSALQAMPDWVTRWTQRTDILDSDRDEVYEIKPVRGAGAGPAQLAGYLEILGLVATQAPDWMGGRARNWKAGTWEPNLELLPVPGRMGEFCVVCVWADPQEQGVLLYDILCCRRPPLPPVPVRLPREAEERRRLPLLDPRALAYAFALTGAAAGAIKYGPQALRALAGLVPRMGVGAGAGGPMLRVPVPAPAAPAGAGGGGAGGAARAVLPRVGAGVAGAGGGGTAGLSLLARGGIIGAAAAISIGSWIGLAKYTYGSVVPGLVAVDLHELYKPMWEALAAIERSYPYVQEEYARYNEALGSLQGGAQAGSQLIAAVRPLYAGVYGAWKAVERAVRNFHAIETRVKRDDLAAFELEAIGTLMAGGQYPSAASPAVGDLAMFLLTAADTLTATIRRLLADREQIIEDESHHVMRPK